MFKAIKFYQGFNGIESQIIGEQDLINIYTNPNSLATVKYIYYAKDQHYLFITTILLVLTNVHGLFLIYTAFETDPNTKFLLG